MERGPPTWAERRYPTRGYVQYDTDTDMVDAPSIEFFFRFQPKQISDSQSEAPLHTVGRSPRHSKGAVPPVREVSSELSEELSDSESDAPPSVLKQKNARQVDRNRGAALNTGRRPSGSAKAATGRPDDDIDLIIGKRKRTSQQEKAVEEEIKLQRSKRKKLIHDLWQDEKARAKELAKKTKESQKLKNDNQRMEISLRK
ncbi:hypothetical protein C8R47DRAFT_333702 [Mycena vitilis]|nr:hypothetical protein C8R47DRAFT_333702 [Mycena vitilis]